MILNTYKKEVVKQIESSIVIETPLYLKYGWSYYKIVDGEKSLWVHDGEQNKSISLVDTHEDNLSHYVENGTKISADEFNEAYCNVHNKMAEIQLMKVDLITS